MLSLFKTKPKLAELIPNGYVDIHSHALPGIDDGAKNMQDSDFLLTSMSSLGFSKVITTPHTMGNVWSNTSETINNALNDVKVNLSSISEKVKLEAASEYFLDEKLMELVQQSKLLPLKENYILVEMSYLNAPMQLYDFLFELQLKGYQLILAHPERYSFFHNRKKEYDKLKKAGCMFQLNLLATVGYYGKDVALVSDYLMKEGMYDFVGSDIHHQKHLQSFGGKIIVSQQKVLQQLLENNKFFK
ncbi:tyrosine-protein phosphatase [Flavobacterium ardleyense]|uniref:protein-tyrosine-phosphatase n=1 Tax=Flavobacterium ardleyense TaxID=2038737 RepID=A0ABW5Z517_9FLAO